MMKTESSIPVMISWVMGILIGVIGILNLLFVHPVPAIILLLISLLYFPPSDILFRKVFGYTVPMAVKAFLFVVIIWFTLGISDLGDMID